MPSFNPLAQLVPDTEDEEESSFVEGPKPTEEEQDKIADDVGKALEENFEELQKVEQAREDAKKSSENGKTNGDHSEPNGEKKDSEENSTEEEDDEEEEPAKEEEPEKEGEQEPEAGPSTEEVKDNESIGSNEAGPSAAKDSTDQKAIEQEEEEDPSNLQLAWEMLELAKTIFTKHADSLDALSPTRLELESKLSETYQTLGEVSIENENYAQAIEDLTMCLRRRQDLLPEDSRCIAETHYQLGVALGFNAQFDEAVGALNDAILVLEKRISLLKESKESQDPSKKDDAFYTRDREIKELEGLIPEIREKIADTKDMKEETFKKLGDRRLMEEAAFASASNGGEKSGPSETPEPQAATIITSKKAAGNISHLVKKRKKSEEEAAAENGDVKKPHLENGASNGNGH